MLGSIVQDPKQTLASLFISPPAETTPFPHLSKVLSLCWDTQLCLVLSSSPNHLAPTVVLANKWTVARGDKQQKLRSRNSVEDDAEMQGKHFFDIVFRRVSTKVHFQLQLRRFKQFHDSAAQQAWHMQTFILHTKAYYIVHRNIHFAHQSILQSTFKYSFYTPKHITWHTQNFHIAHQGKSSW